MPLYSYFYLVRCRDGSLYAGVTTELWRRIGELNSGREKKVRRPVMLVYAERYALKRSALRRKREIRALQQTGEASNASVHAAGRRRDGRLVEPRDRNIGIGGRQLLFRNAGERTSDAAIESRRLNMPAELQGQRRATAGRKQRREGLRHEARPAVMIGRR
jgi:putative endonuclease